MIFFPFPSVPRKKEKKKLTKIFTFSCWTFTPMKLFISCNWLSFNSYNSYKSTKISICLLPYQRNKSSAPLLLLYQSFAICQITLQWRFCLQIWAGRCRRPTFASAPAASALPTFEEERDWGRSCIWREEGIWREVLQVLLSFISRLLPD